MSPEQARGEGIDARSDLFSLGSVMYAMCTGHPPFRAETPYGILRRITDEPARSITETNPNVPSWLTDIVDRLLQKDPERRYKSATAVASLLEDCLAHVQHPSRVPLPAELTQSAFHRNAKRLVFGLAAVVVGIGLMVSGSPGLLDTDDQTNSTETHAADAGSRTAATGTDQSSGTGSPEEATEDPSLAQSIDDANVTESELEWHFEDNLDSVRSSLSELRAELNNDLETVD